MRAAVGVSAVIGIVATLIAVSGAAFYWFDDYVRFGTRMVDSSRIPLLDLFDLLPTQLEKFQPNPALPVMLALSLAFIAIAAIIAIANLVFHIPQKAGSLILSWVVATAAAILPMFVLIMCSNIVDPLNGVEGPAPGMLVLGGAAMATACVLSLGVHAERERRAELEYTVRTLQERASE